MLSKQLTISDREFNRIKTVIHARCTNKRDREMRRRTFTLLGLLESPESAGHAHSHSRHTDEREPPRARTPWQSILECGRGAGRRRGLLLVLQGDEVMRMGDLLVFYEWCERAHLTLIKSPPHPNHTLRSSGDPSNPKKKDAVGKISPKKTIVIRIRSPSTRLGGRDGSAARLGARIRRG